MVEMSTKLTSTSYSTLMILWVMVPGITAAIAEIDSFKRQNFDISASDCCIFERTSHLRSTNNYQKFCCDQKYFWDY